MQPLYAVTSVFNPLRYRSRHSLYLEFAEHMRRAGVTLVTAEVAFGRREHVLTDHSNPYHLQLRTDQELWHKETAINLSVQRLSQLHPDWQYVSWIDADVHFNRDDWPQETVHALQHYAVVQPWSQAIDLDPDGQAFHAPMWSFCHARLNGLHPSDENPAATRGGDPYGATKAKHMTVPVGIRGDIRGWCHPGLAWAFRREAWDGLGGMFDLSIVGHADTIMALSLLGRSLECSGIAGTHRSFMHAVSVWQQRALKIVRKNIGVVPGVLSHRWHGKKDQRGYGSRRAILSDCAVNPYEHFHRDAQGLLKLHDDGSERYVRLRDALRAWARSRNEDSIDV